MSVTGTHLQNAMQSSGRPLDKATRASFETGFGHDFSRVRVHTDEGAARSALSIGAKAYTVGSDIIFGLEQYSSSSTGRRLLAHELTHVVQQSRRSSTHASGFNSAGSRSLEEEADTVSDAVVSGRSVRVSGSTSAPAVQRQAADPREQITRLAESKDPGSRQQALDLIVLTYFKKPPAFAGIVYDPNYVANIKGRNPSAKISPQHADTLGDFGGPQTVTIGPHFFRNFRQRYAQRVRTIGHELQHVEQRSPSETKPGKRSLGSTFLGGLAGAAAGAGLGAVGLGIAATAGASLTPGLIGAVLGAGALIGGIVGGVLDPFRPKEQKKEPVRNSHTREFLSIYWAVTAEVHDLEQMDLDQRILEIEEPRAGALAEYGQMPKEDQKRYERQYQDLIKLLSSLKKQQELSKAGDFPGPEPPRATSDEVEV